MCLDMSSCSNTSVCLLNVDLRSPFQLSLRLSRKLYSRLEGLGGARACRVDDEEAEGPPRRFFWRWLSASKSMANLFKKSVTLKLKRNATGEDPWKNVRTGFDGELVINRNDFGVNGLPPVVGPEIKLWLSIEGIKK